MSVPILAMMAAAVVQLPACPPAKILNRTKPVALHIERELPPAYASRRIVSGPDDQIALTKFYGVEGVPASFGMIRSPGSPGTTRVYVLCLAPWGDILCGRLDVDSPGPAPMMFVRLVGKDTLVVFRREEEGKRLYEGWTFSQFDGFHQKCGMVQPTPRKDK